MKDHVLSIERMQHLKELGIDTSKASMVLIVTDEYGDVLDWDEEIYKYEADDKNFEYFDAETGNYDHSYRNDCGVFTLNDICDLIPKNIITNDSHRDKVYFVADFSDKVMGYAYHFETCGEISYYRFFNWLDNIIDAAYEMLLWCIYEGYIKTNKDK